MKDMLPKKKKIAVLGGGLGSLVTVWELTNQPNWNALYEITVYQMGWRLGGKCASGRNVKPSQGENRDIPNYRIEEHGLHIFFGFYEDAFRILKQAYEELGGNGPFQSVSDAFKPHSFVSLQEFYQNRWVPWDTNFPTNNLVPWEGGASHSILEHIETALRYMYQVWNESPTLKSGDWLSQNPQQSNDVFTSFLLKITRLKTWQLFPAVLPALPFVPYLLLQSVIEKPFRLVEGEWYERRQQDLETAVNEVPNMTSGSGLFALALRIISFLIRDIEDVQEDVITLYSQLLGNILSSLRSLMEPIYANERLLENDYLRRRLILLNFGMSNIRGLLADGILLKGCFDSLNNYDYADWLRRHGALEMTIQSPPVRMIYDLVYGYENGDIKKPRLAAGVALRAISKMLFEYEGAIMWKMQAGMGDVVLTPLYEVLKRRGVKFKFFHNVANLGLSEDRKSIETIKINIQATVKNQAEYQPLIEVKRLLSWPSEPLYEQLEQGETLRTITAENPFNNPLESFWTTWQPVEQITLKAEQDFDIVVLGISIAALPYICPELMAASQAWRDMITHVKTVTTQGGQLWLKETLSQLGWQRQSPVLGSYVEPLDTYADMTYLIERENWQCEDFPYNLAYFTGVIPDPGIAPPENDQFPQQQQDKIHQDTLHFLSNNMGYLWPQATTPANPQGLDWNLLVDCNGSEGVNRFYEQYWRINIIPTERYVMSLPGSIKYRLKTDKSGFNRLYLAGDWIDNGFNAGAVEPTVISGMQATRAILKHEFGVEYTQKITHERDFYL